MKMFYQFIITAFVLQQATIAQQGCFLQNPLAQLNNLHANLETVKNCSENKDHWVYFSSEVIVTATKIAAKIIGLWAKVVYGFGKKRVNVRYVYK